MYTLIVEELSKVKQDLEGVLKDVLQAMRINQEAATSDGAIDIANLERVANVSMSPALHLMLNITLIHFRYFPCTFRAESTTDSICLLPAIISHSKLDLTQPV